MLKEAVARRAGGHSGLAALRTKTVQREPPVAVAGTGADAVDA